MTTSAGGNSRIVKQLVASSKRSLILILILIVVVAVSLPAGAFGQQEESKSGSAPRIVSRDVLPEALWLEVEQAIDRGLAFISRQQNGDGSFHHNLESEPGISGLCVMAFLSRGHLPGQGPYGINLNRSVEYMLNSQHPDGLIARSRQPYFAPYSHGICSLAISELYGMSPSDEEPRLRQAIEKAMVFTSHRYSQPKASADDEGSWRYLKRHRQSDGDLSITSWNVMFLRSAKNSGFKVDIALIDDALGYMKRVYDPKVKTFRYEIHTDDPQHNHTRAMAGAGALSLALSGEHHSELAENAARYILKRPFDQYDRPAPGEEHPCYSAFYCSQAMFQMGGEYWTEFYPQLVKTLLKAQRADGSWLLKQGADVPCGPAYMTAMTVMALTPPYQMLPIFQR